MRSAKLNRKTRAPRDYAVSSVRKALELLGCFTPRATSWPLSELARTVCIPKSTAHNLLRTLQAFDLVRQDPETHLYHLGPRALELGLAFSRGTDLLSLARPQLSRLAETCGETVKLGILSRDQVLIIAAVESRHQLHTRGDVGTRWPLHSTSLGKAILSVLPAEKAAEILTHQGMQRFTPATLTTWAELEGELKRIRSRGYALDLEENESGVCCIAVPVTDSLQRTVAAISISGPCVRIRGAALEEFTGHVMTAARTIARYLDQETL
ncbi:MAG TPA: IclR family transcriptional regulator [Bryobacteraceae bacterium]|nr:IclR family transcriptional regulator [Bryobacteraceae bacterium]